MSIVFEEEQRSIEKDLQLAESRNKLKSVEQSGKKIHGLFEKATTLLFGVFCMVSAYYIYTSNQPSKGDILYREDVTLEQLSLLPEDLRFKFMNSLPSRPAKNTFDNTSENTSDPVIKKSN
jgi:hypothetical protein